MAYADFALKLAWHTDCYSHPAIFLDLAMQAIESHIRSFRDQSPCLEALTLRRGNPDSRLIYGERSPKDGIKFPRLTTRFLVSRVSHVPATLWLLRV